MSVRLRSEARCFLATASINQSFYSMFEDNLRPGYSGMGPGTVTPTAAEPGGQSSAWWVGAAAAFKAAP